MFALCSKQTEFQLQLQMSTGSTDNCERADNMCGILVWPEIYMRRKQLFSVGVDLQGVGYISDRQAVFIAI